MMTDVFVNARPSSFVSVISGNIYLCPKIKLQQINVTKNKAYVDHIYLNKVAIIAEIYAIGVVTT